MFSFALEATKICHARIKTDDCFLLLHVLNSVTTVHVHVPVPVRNGRIVNVYKFYKINIKITEVPIQC